MKVDIYICGRGSLRIAKYLSNVLKKDYDTDGESIFIIEDVDSEKLPERFLRSPVMKRLEIRDKEKSGELIWPVGIRYA
ncbi:MAG: hypothetical protein QXN71_03320 [Candidatus Aenigmatarchaeota archaeon]